MSLSMDRWRGKVAIVTGASAGIGESIAAKLVEEGLQVVGFARRVEKIEENAKKLAGKKGKLHGFKVDMTKEEDILKGFEWTTKNLGPVHILVNNAGLATATNLTEGDTEKWKLTLDTNVLGLCIATREAVKSMKANKVDGHVIHINSLAGHAVRPGSGVNVYAASKYAVTALTETLRQEFNQLGLKIKVTSLSPGLVETEMVQKAVKEGFPAVTEYLKKYGALKPEDIADGALYVLSTPPHVQIHELTLRPFGP